MRSLSPAPVAGPLIVTLAVIICSASPANAQLKFQALPKLTEPFLVELYHKYGSEPSGFVRKGSVAVRPPTEYRAASAELKQEPLGERELAAIQRAADADELYYLKARVQIARPQREQPLASTNQTEDETYHENSIVVRSCSLLSDKAFLTVNLNHKNEFVGLNFHTSNPRCLPAPHSRLASVASAHATKVSVAATPTGPYPDTATYIKRLEEERRSKLRENKSDNRSFFGKYWMYILPFIFFLMVMGGPAQEQGAR